MPPYNKLNAHKRPVKSNNKLKAESIMEFVNIQIGAFDSNFVETNEVSLYSLYRFAQLHIMDNYNVEVKSITEHWGEGIEWETRNSEENGVKRQTIKAEIKKIIKDYDEKINDVRTLLDASNSRIKYLRKNEKNYSSERKERSNLHTKIHAYQQAKSDIDSLLDYV